MTKKPTPKATRTLGMRNTGEGSRQYTSPKASEGSIPSGSYKGGKQAQVAGRAAANVFMQTTLPKTSKRAVASVQAKRSIGKPKGGK